MKYQNKSINLNSVHKMVFVSILLAFALVLSYIENSFFVLPIPGVKLGLANLIILASLYFLNFKEVMLLVILRVTINSFFGSFFTFWYSLSGGILSFLVMFLLIRVCKNKISTIGVSVVGAVVHNIGQLIVVMIVTENINVAATYFPILAISGIVTGVLIGLTVNYLLPYIKKIID